MKLAFLYPWLALVALIALVTLLAIYLTNKIKQLRRTFTIKDQQGATVNFVIAESEDFNVAFEAALNRLRAQKNRG